MYLKGKQDPEWDSFQFTTLDGGMVTPKEYEQARQDLDQRTFRQELREHLKIMLKKHIITSTQLSSSNKKLN